MSQALIPVQLRDAVFEVDRSLLELCPELSSCLSQRQDSLELDFLSRSGFELLADFLSLCFELSFLGSSFDQRALGHLLRSICAHRCAQVPDLTDLLAFSSALGLSQVSRFAFLALGESLTPSQCKTHETFQQSGTPLYN